MSLTPLSERATTEKRRGSMEERGCVFLKRLPGEGLGTCPNSGPCVEGQYRAKVSDVNGTVHVPGLKHFIGSRSNSWSKNHGER